MSIDLLIQSGTKLAIEQWMQARGLMVRDTYTTTDPETLEETITGYSDWRMATGVQFHWWNSPSGKITSSIDNTDPDNPVVTQFSGFYGRLSLDSIPAPLKTWVETSTATAVLESFSGVGGEGIVILNPEDVYGYLQANNLPVWGGLLGVSNQWSDPALWAFQNVMTGDTREFDGVTYESLIDFNVWTPTQYPQGWTEVGPAEPDPPATPEWAAGTTYAVDDEVTYEGTTYRCIQGHTAIVGWQPPNVPALWEAI